MGCHFLLQGIFQTQGSNPGLLCCRQSPALQADSLLTKPPGKLTTSCVADVYPRNTDKMIDLAKLIPTRASFIIQLNKCIYIFHSSPLSLLSRLRSLPLEWVYVCVREKERERGGILRDFFFQSSEISVKLNCWLMTIPESSEYPGGTQ